MHVCQPKTTGQVCPPKGRKSLSFLVYSNDVFSLIESWNIFSFYLLLNILGWHWLRKLYSFWVYNSIVHPLYSAFGCLPLEVKSPSVARYLTPFTLYGPTPFPSGDRHTVVCVYLSCLIICCFQFYIPHTSEIIWFLTLSDLFYLVWYPQDPSMLLKMAAFPFFSFKCQSWKENVEVIHPTLLF